MTEEPGDSLPPASLSISLDPPSSLPLLYLSSSLTTKKITKDGSFSHFGTQGFGGLPPLYWARNGPKGGGSPLEAQTQKRGPKERDILMSLGLNWAQEDVPMNPKKDEGGKWAH